MSSVNESLTNEWVCEEKGANETLLIAALAWFFRAQCGSCDWRILEVQFSVRAFNFFFPFGEERVKHDGITFPAHYYANALKTALLRVRQESLNKGYRARVYDDTLRTIAWTFVARMSIWIQIHSLLFELSSSEDWILKSNKMAQHTSWNYFA